MFNLHVFLFSTSLYCTGAAPNVLWIISDDLRPSLGSYGSSSVWTPNIDRLVQKSTRFWNVHAQQALCGPSRTSFLTSRHPDSLKVYDQYGPYWRTHAGNYTSIPQYFKEAGYVSFSLGKVFHPGEISGKTDDYPYSWTETPYHPSSYRYENEKVCPDEHGVLHRNVICPVDVEGQPEKTLPDIQTIGKAMDILEAMQKSSKSFFLAVGLYKPHIPFRYPKQYDELYNLSDIKIAENPHKPKGMPTVAWNPFMDLKKRDDVAKLNISFPYGEIPFHFQKKLIRSYYASVSYIDDLIGSLIDKLQALDLLKNTIIVFMGDHGWSLGEHGEWCKYSNFDVATRVPLSIFVPPIVNMTSTSDVYDLAELVDLFPTLVELAGQPTIQRCQNLAEITCTDGKSLVPLIQGQRRSSGQNISISQYPRPSVTPQVNSDAPRRKDITVMGYAVKWSELSYIEWVKFNSSTLLPDFNTTYAKEKYNRTSDPGEDNNLCFTGACSKQDVFQLQKLFSKRKLPRWVDMV